MGLDMYLERMPRYGDITPSEINAMQAYFSWKRDKENPESSARKYTFKGWTGIDYKTLPPKQVRDFYEQHVKFSYAYWDVEQKYSGRYRIIEEVGYWRKANQIHRWFVDNIQDGIDDCGYYEVTKADLKDLLETCKTVLENCELVDGQIADGVTFKNGEAITNYVEGKYVKDDSVARMLLPTTSGFFFGGTDYDEWYVKDIKNTIDIITEVLENTDFENEMICYTSSW